MPFVSTTQFKISLVILAVSRIAIAIPAPNLLGSALPGRGEQASGGSVYTPSHAAGGDSPSLGGLDLLELLSGNGGAGGKVDSTKAAKGVGGSSLAGERYRQGNTASKSVGSFGDSAQGGSVSGGGSVLNILSGNGGDGGGASGGLSILDIVRKRDL